MFENSNNKTIWIVVTVLLVGLVLGYIAGAGSAYGYGPMTKNFWGGSGMMNNGYGGMMRGYNYDDMTKTMSMMTQGLSNLTGDQFDAAFLEQMIIHHQGAIAMAQMVKATSKRPELLKLADDIITAQTKEINQMNSWLIDWFVNQ